MADVTLKDVRKTYPGGVEAVKGISMDIADGEFIVLVGPSGCGKSTLLRMVAGLEAITDGTVSIGGEVVNNREPADRDIAMVFQNYALYPHMSVYNNLAYGLRNRGVNEADIKTRVDAAAKMLELSEYLQRKPRQLSGGQRQRVAMGRAIVRSPKAFLFDEPLSNLDAKLRVQMRLEIRNLQRRLATTSLYVTHDQLEAMTLADRLVVMNAGEVEQIGAPMEVYERPASTFVAAFIGSPAMNLIPRAGLNGAIVTAMPDAAHTVGVRAETVELTETASASDNDAIRLPVEVTAIEPVGAESYVHVSATGGENAPVSLVVRQQGQARYDAGQTLTAHIPADAVHLYGQDTKRL